MKVFIINLERSKDRRKIIEQEIEKIFLHYPNLKNKLEFHFFKAVDAKNKEHLEFKNHFTWLGKVYAGGESMSEPEKACFASHYLLWQKCIDLDENILILEDDVILNEEGIKHIDEIINLPYECVRFNYKENKIAYRIEENIGVVLKNNSFGAFAYFLSPCGAKKLLIKANIWFCPVDYYLDMFYFHKVWHLMYNIRIVKFLNTKTTIHHIEVKLWEKILKITMRPLVKFFSHIYKFIFLFFHNPKKELKKWEKE